MNSVRFWTRLVRGWQRLCDWCIAVIDRDLPPIHYDGYVETPQERAQRHQREWEERHQR